MIRLKNLLNEASFLKENRINLMKITTILEKVLEELPKTKTKKLTEVFTEFSVMSEKLNQLPFNYFNMTEWKFLNLAAHVKLTELREEVLKLIKEDNTSTLTPLINALDEVLS